MNPNESNVTQAASALSPQVIKEVGQSPSELTPPELLALILQKMNTQNLILIAAFNLNSSDFDLSDPTSTTT